MVYVYPANCTDFSGNGLGAVDPLECTVTETLNGEWELTLVHPIDEFGKWQRLKEGCILRAPVPASMTPKIDMMVKNTSRSTVDVLIYRVSTDRDPLRLRSGNSGKYKVIGKYAKGTEVIVLDRSDPNWFEVACPDGKRGYMSTAYLTYVRTEQKTIVKDAGFTSSAVESRQLRDQPFRIYRIVPELDKVTVYARHIFYDLLDNMIQKYEPSPSDPGAAVAQAVSAACLSEHDFNFCSDITSTAKGMLVENLNPVEALLGEGGFVEKYGAELARDWYDVFLVERVGRDSGVQIREEKNLLGISFDVDETDVVTRIMPTGEDADGNVLYLPELFVDSPHLNEYTHPKWIHLPVTDAAEVTDGDEKRTKEECYSLLRKAAQAEFDAGCDLPNVFVTVDFINCADTEEYRRFTALSNIFLGDSVRVIAKRIGIEVSLRMTSYTYNCLTWKYDSITLGAAAPGIADMTVTSRQIPSGSIKGMKLAMNSVGTGHILSGSVGSLQIKNAAIETAHISKALIDQLSVNSITAIRADIRKLVAGNITTDQLYADLASIATAQITAANINKANINWADIQTLTAQLATIVQAEIKNVKIESADIEDLEATVAEITRAQISQAEIDGAKIKAASIDSAKIALGSITSALIAQGAVGTAQIADGSITDAKIVSLNADVITAGTLSVERLLIKGKNGLFRAINATDSGLTVEQLSQETYQNALSGTVLVARSVTADKIAAKSITANEILSGTITAAEIDVTNLFAAEASITAIENIILRTETIEALKGELNLWADEKITLAVQDKADADDVDALGTQIELLDSAIALRATKTEMNTAIRNIKVGGKNLLLDSAPNYYVATYNAGSFYLGSDVPAVGEQVTVRLWAKLGSDRTRFMLYNSGAGVLLANLTDNLNDTHTATFTWKAASTNDRVTIWQLPNTGTSASTIQKIKLERGNRTTDWSPCPDDAQNDIDALSTRVTNSETAIEQNAEQIELRAKQTDVDSLTGRMSTAESKIAQTPFDISLAVGSIKVGGNNLLRGTQYWDSKYWVGIENMLVNGEAVTIDASGLSSGYTEIYQNVYLSPGETYMLSFNVTETSAASSGYLHIFAYDAVHQTHFNGLYTANAATLGRYQARFTAPAGSSIFHIFLRAHAGRKFTVKHMQLEVGSTATQWRPSPDDNAKGVVNGSNLQITTDGVHIETPIFTVNVSGSNGDMSLSESGLAIDQINSPSVMACYTGPSYLWVGGTADGVSTFASLSDAFAVLSNRFIPHPVEIRFSASTFESCAGLRNTFGERITVIGNGYTLNGIITLSNMANECAFTQLNVATNGSGTVLTACACANIEWHGGTISGSTSYHGAYARASRLSMFSTQIDNCYMALKAEYGSSIYIQSCTGSGNTYACGSYQASLLGMYGSRPGASYGLYCERGSWMSDDPGSAGGGSTITPTVTSTVTLTATNSRTHDGGGWYSGTNVVSQGKTSDGGIYKGCMWFDVSSFSGRTVQSARIRLYRRAGVGKGNPVVVLIGTMSNTSPSGGVATVTAFTDIIGNVDQKEWLEASIPVAAAQQLANGTAKGIYTYGSATNYAQFDGYTDANPPQLIVTYN